MRGANAPPRGGRQVEGEFRVGLRRHVAGVAIAVVVDARGLAGPVGDDATGVPVVVVARVGVRGEQPEGVVVAAAKPAAEWFLRAKRGTLRVGDCVYTTPGPSGGTAGVPEVRADSVQGLAGRSRGYPRVSSGSDTSGDTIPASGRFTSC